MRGNQRTSGELSRKEGGKIFGSGSRTPISITILVRKPNHTGSAAIHYEAVADYLSREEKLALVSERGSMLSNKMSLSSIAPNEAGDWINQRDGLFETFIPLGDKKSDHPDRAVFMPFYSRGVATGRDVWCYNFSRSVLSENMMRTIDFYHSHFDKQPTYDLTRISWTDETKSLLQKRRRTPFDDRCIRNAMYRPFCKQQLYFNHDWNTRPYQMPRLFPTPQSKNLVICVPGVGTKKGFMPFIVDTIPDVQLQFNGQCFPLYYYEKNASWAESEKKSA